MRLFLTVIGLIMVLEGMPYFLIPHKFKEIMIIMQKLSDSHLRLIGFVSMLMGLVVIYLAKLL
ncbi:MAG: DUF2065 domain-containing protein [bacterium]